MSKLPTFRRISAPLAAKRHQSPSQRSRPSPAERGYDAEWTKLSVEYRQKHPFCAECDRRGYVVMGDVVDHIIPVSISPELRLKPENFQTLCTAHHNGWKRKMENYAKAWDTYDLLPKWCRDPASRPGRFKLRKHHYAKA